MERREKRRSSELGLTPIHAHSSTTPGPCPCVVVPPLADTVLLLLAAPVPVAAGSERYTAVEMRFIVDRAAILI